MKPDLENSGVSGSRHTAATDQQPLRERPGRNVHLEKAVSHFGSFSDYDSTFVQKCDFSMWTFVVAVFFKSLHSMHFSSYEWLCLYVICSSKQEIN